MPGQLDRSVWRETLVPFVTVLVLSLGLLIANRLLKILPWMFEIQLPLGELLATLGWLVPSFLVYALPIAAWIGWIAGYGRLGVDGEITAMASLGLSPWRVLRPALLSGLALTMLSLALCEWGYGQGRRQFATAIAEIAQGSALQALRPGTVARLPGDLVVGVPSDGQGLWIGREGDAVLWTSTAIPEPDMGRIRLGEGFGSMRGTADPTMFGFGGGEIELDLGRRVAGPPGARELSMRELWADRAELSRQVEWHQRLALAGGLLFAPLAAFLAAPRRSRSGRGAAILVSLVGLTAYYGLFTAGKQLALKAWLPAGVGLWLGNLALIAWGAFGLFRRSSRPGMP